MPAGRPRSVNKYQYHEIAHCWFRYGFMEYTKERPKITDRINAWEFKLDGMPVRYIMQNYRTFRVSCPQCGRMCQSMHRWPEPGAKWGCKKCVKFEYAKEHCISVYALTKKYKIDELMKLTPAEITRLTGEADAVKVIAKILENPASFYKTEWAFRKTDKLQWRTDDDRIPMVAQIARKLQRRKGAKKRHRAYKIKARVTLPVLKALQQFSTDNGLTLERGAGALLRWTMAHSDKIQIRPI